MTLKTMTDELKKVKAGAFNWVFMALMGVLIWIGKDMHSDLKTLMLTIPAMQKDIDYLQDRQLINRMRIQQLPNPPKHEEQITYDSLTQNK